jgi:predicted secreted protein
LSDEQQFMSQSLTETDNGHTLEMKVNDTFDLRLRESRMGGYRWNLQESGAPFLNVVERKGETQSTSSPRGQPNLRTWRFVARQPGLARVQLRHRRPWEEESSGTQFALTVKIVA